MKYWNIGGTMNQKITIVSYDDWIVLYVDGIAIYQDHNLDVDDFVKILSNYGVAINFERKYLTDQGCKKLQETGYFPNNLNELELEEN